MFLSRDALTGWVFAEINEWKSVIFVRKWCLSNKTSVFNILLLSSRGAQIISWCLRGGEIKPFCFDYIWST